MIAIAATSTMPRAPSIVRRWWDGWTGGGSPVGFMARRRAPLPGSFLHPAVARLRTAVGIELVGGPEHPLGHEVEVAAVGDGVVVVADGRAGTAGLLRPVGVGPGDDRLILPLLALRQHFGVPEDRHVVVELLVDRRPILQPAGDRVALVGVGDLDRLL